MEGSGGTQDDANFVAQTSPSIDRGVKPETSANLAPRSPHEIATSLIQLLVDRNNGSIDAAVSKDLLDKNVTMVESLAASVALKEEVEAQDTRLKPGVVESYGNDTQEKTLASIQKLTDAQRTVGAEYLVIALLSQDPQNVELVQKLRARYEADVKAAVIQPTIFGKWRPRPDARIGEEIARVELIIDGLVKGPSNEDSTIGMHGRWEADENLNIVEKEGGEAREKRQEELENQSVKYGGRRITYVTDPAIATSNYLAQNATISEQAGINLGQLKAAVVAKK